VTIPGNGSVTGVVFNTGGVGKGFNDDAFLFASEDGTISGWRGALGTTAETLQTAIPTSRGSSWIPICRPDTRHSTSRTSAARTT